MSESDLLHALCQSSVFVGLDFETCDSRHQYPCAMAVVRVENNTIVRQAAHFIHQPAHLFNQHTIRIHGIKPSDVTSAPKFPEVWKAVAPLFAGARFICAHNAGFEKAVLSKTVMREQLPLLTLPFVCTMRLARTLWNVFPTKLDHVCAHLGIPLTHHDPLSDAAASVQIVLRAITNMPTKAPTKARAGKSESPFTRPLRRE